MRGRQCTPLLLLRMDDHSMWNTLLGLGSTASEPSSALGLVVAGCSPLLPSQGQNETGQRPTLVPTLGEPSRECGKSHRQELGRKEQCGLKLP